MISSVCPESAGLPATPEGIALLVEGTVASAGMPGFGKNAIPCLMGVYRLDSGLAVAARVTREPLVFRDGLWKKAEGYSRAAWEGSDDGLVVIVVEGSVRMRDGGSARWYYAIAFDPGVPASTRADFVNSFAPKADEFISASSNPADISLPAVLRMGKRG